MVDVHLIRVFEGPRHEILYRLWDVIAEYCAAKIRVIWFANTRGFSHAECLNRIWAQSADSHQTRLVLTEADFLPSLRNTDTWLQNKLDHSPEIAFAGVRYAKRSPGTRKVVHFDMPGAWFLSLDKSRCPQILDFHGPPDPATRLVEQLNDTYDTVTLYKGRDEYPRFLSLAYPFGVHLFWSRHLNDDPSLRVSGFSCQEIQSKHDRRVRKWLSDQPPAFRKLAKDRLGSRILG